MSGEGPLNLWGSEVGRPKPRLAASSKENIVVIYLEVLREYLLWCLDGSGLELGGKCRNVLVGVDLKKAIIGTNHTDEARRGRRR